MQVTAPPTPELDMLKGEIDKLLAQLGSGIVEGVAYDTAWAARLVKRYPNQGFERSLEWLRQHQHEDGSWGADVLHYHDRFVSTLAAIVALRDVGDGAGDEARIRRGETALWQFVGKLGRDDSDTVGFPIVSTGLTEEALKLGLDVPMPPIRYATAYREKVEKLLAQPTRDWRTSPLSFSLEALRSTIGKDDLVFEKNNTVGVSPAATAGYLLELEHAPALQFLSELAKRDDGAIPAVTPIDSFEISWVIDHLAWAGIVDRTSPQVKRALAYLYQHWSPTRGIAYATTLGITDLDDTAMSYFVLRWGGYDVDPNVFSFFEKETSFSTLPFETNPSLSANIHLLKALSWCTTYPNYTNWLEKAFKVVRNYDQGTPFWWDKWHASPYYVNTRAASVLRPLSPSLAASRIKWILRTQNSDGGWGYLGHSTGEETAYCLQALLEWDECQEQLEPARITAAADFLRHCVARSTYTSLWIGKSLYTPNLPVKAAILSALFRYDRHVHQEAGYAVW